MPSSDRQGGLAGPVDAAPGREVRRLGGSGEIDVMEARGQEPNKVLGTLHYGSRWPANTHAGKDYVLPRGGSIADFHVYALEWEPGEIRWYVDGRRYATQSFWWSSGKTDGCKGAKPTKRGRAQPLAGPVRSAVLPRHERGRGRQVPGQPGRDDGVPRPRWSSIMSGSTTRSRGTERPSCAAKENFRFPDPTPISCPVVLRQLWIGSMIRIFHVPEQAWHPAIFLAFL